MPDRFERPDFTAILGAGVVVFGALFYLAALLFALFYLPPILYAFALAGVGVTYLSYNVQAISAQGIGGRVLIYAGIVLVALSVLIGAVFLVFVALA